MKTKIGAASVALILALIAETTLVSFPLVLITGVIFFIIIPKVRTVMILFLVGFISDVNRGSFIGITPLVLFSVLLIINFYSRFFDIHDYFFILAVIVLASLIYSNFVDYQINMVILGMIVGVVTIIGLLILKKNSKMNTHYEK